MIQKGYDKYQLSFDHASIHRREKNKPAFPYHDPYNWPSNAEKYHCHGLKNLKNFRNCTKKINQKKFKKYLEEKWTKAMTEIQLSLSRFWRSWNRLSHLAQPSEKQNWRKNTISSRFLVASGSNEKNIVLNFCRNDELSWLFTNRVRAF